VVREDRLGTAQADLRRARDTGRTGGAEVDVVGGITGLILGVLVTNVFVATQGRAVVLTWASVGLDLAYSRLIGSVVGRTPHSGPPQNRPPNPCAAHDQAPRQGQ
jgi:hypothetical protein